MRRHEWGDVLAAVFLLAIVGVLVRPSSQAPAFVGAFGDGMKALITYAVTG